MAAKTPKRCPATRERLFLRVFSVFGRAARVMYATMDNPARGWNSSQVIRTMRKAGEGGGNDRASPRGSVAPNALSLLRHA